MRTPNKQEFPPLLQPGLHVMTSDDFHNLCVSRFGLSQSRGVIFNNIMTIIKLIEQTGLKANLWINGSYLTEKIDPADADMAIEFSMQQFNSSVAGQQAVTSLVNNPTVKSNFSCDIYCFAKEDIVNRAYWLGWFSFSRTDMPKGIAVVQICGGL